MAFFPDAEVPDRRAHAGGLFGHVMGGGIGLLDHGGIALGGLVHLVDRLIDLPQIGILRRVVVIDVQDDHGLIELVNPEIIAAEGEQGGPEGCLSVPGRQGFVYRPQKVTVRAQDRHGKVFELTGEDLLARALCHEIDHLDGKMYVDIEDHEIVEEEDEEEQE